MVEDALKISSRRFGVAAREKVEERRQR